MDDATVDAQAALVALLRERPGGAGWIKIVDTLLQETDAEAARDLLKTDDLFGDSEHEEQVAIAQRDLQAWSEAGFDFWSVLDPRYPARVRDIHEAPPFLFARGAAVDGDVGFSVVGSRKASERGIRTASAISALLVEKGLTVVAGLAEGIDAIAHQTALDKGGRTVAVIGTGIDRHYPASNRDLQQRIERDGLVLSQFWPGSPPTKQSFPMRNAVMSGYGFATIVVEAGEQSGTRIQARLAVHHGRPVILTEAVVETTQWGKELREKSDVYVASSLEEISTLIDRIVDRPNRVDAALTQIAL
ncbi:MAG: DNA-processing protein DprA [Pseudonocardiaceae bacterium]